MGEVIFLMYLPLAHCIIN